MIDTKNGYYFDYVSLIEKKIIYHSIVGSYVVDKIFQKRPMLDIPS